MKPYIPGVNLLRVAALGLLALFVASFSMPTSAQAAFVKDVDLGNISVKTGDWNPAKDSVFFSFGFNYAGGGGVGGEYQTSSGLSRWSGSMSRGEQYTVNYRFSLYDQASLKLSGGVYYSDGPYPRELTLTGPGGKIVYSGPSTTIPELSSLQGGDYIITISGYSPLANKLYESFSMTTSGGTPLPPDPGDVPLPGALVLLGSALVGAGAYARRRAKKQAVA